MYHVEASGNADPSQAQVHWWRQAHRDKFSDINYLPCGVYEYDYVKEMLYKQKKTLCLGTEKLHLSILAYFFFNVPEKLFTIQSWCLEAS